MGKNSTKTLFFDQIIAAKSGKDQHKTTILFGRNDKKNS